MVASCILLFFYYIFFKSSNKRKHLQLWQDDSSYSYTDSATRTSAPLPTPTPTHSHTQSENQHVWLPTIISNSLYIYLILCCHLLEMFYAMQKGFSWQSLIKTSRCAGARLKGQTKCPDCRGTLTGNRMDLWGGGGGGGGGGSVHTYLWCFATDCRKIGLLFSESRS